MKLKVSWCLLTLAGALTQAPLSAQVAAMRIIPQGGEPDSSTVTVATAKDAAQCLKYASGEWDRQYSAAKKAQKKWNDTLDKAANEAQTSVAKQCLVRFPLKSVKDVELTTIAGLYSTANLRDSAKIVAKLAVERAHDDSTRVKALAFAIPFVGPGYSDSGAVAIAAAAEAEVLVKKLDALGSAWVKERFAAHSTAANFYRKPEQSELKLPHLNTMLELAPQLSPEARKGQSYYLTSAYTKLAEYYLDKGDPEKAKATLNRAMSETADLGEENQRTIKSAMLVGDPSPPLVASNWFNAPEGTTEMEAKGKVSLVMITAHW
jgi:hypothetical protein